MARPPCFQRGLRQVPRPGCRSHRRRGHCSLRPDALGHLRGPLRGPAGRLVPPPCSAKLATAGRPAPVSPHTRLRNALHPVHVTRLGFEFSSEMEFCPFLCMFFTVFRSFQKEETRDILRPGVKAFF